MEANRDDSSVPDRDILQPPKKRRRLCPYCNQWLAKTAYWEHQKFCVGNTSFEWDSSDSELNFELESSNVVDPLNLAQESCHGENDSHFDVQGTNYYNTLQHKHVCYLQY